MIDRDNLDASLWAFVYCALLVLQCRLLVGVVPHLVVIVLAIFVLPFLATALMALMWRAKG